MSRLGFALSMLALVAAAAWAYHVNYETQEALARLAKVKAEIAREEERLRVLEVEWARLTAPDRLRRLVAEHNGRLMLMPMAPDHHGEVAAIPYPPRPPLTSGLETNPKPLPPLSLSTDGAVPAADREGAR